MNRLLNVLGFTTLFGTLWVVTIVVYGVSTGSFITGAKLGIITSLSKAVIAKAHHWGWSKVHVRFASH